LFLVIGALLSTIFQVSYDAFTVSDEEQQIIGLSESLKPFEELATKFYPDIEQKTALTNLKNDFENLRKQFQAEKNTLKEFEAKLKITFSGKWKKSPASIVPVSLGTPPPRYIEFLKTDFEKEKPIKFIATQLYSRKSVAYNRVVFESRQAVPEGNFPLGKNIDELSKYDKIRIYMPLNLRAQNFEGERILIERLEISFFINNREHKKIDLQKMIPFEVPVKNRWAIFDYKTESNLYTVIVNI